MGTTETFTVNTASGSAAFGITGQAGDTAQSQLDRLNQDLGTVGLSASIDATGKLAFSSVQAFSVSITGAGLATGGETGINSALNNQSLTYVAADNPATYTIAEGGKSVNISVATGLSDSAALQSINSQLSDGGITDLQAVADGSATTGHFSLQGGSSFNATVTGTTTGVAGTSRKPPAVAAH
ncbi:MAG: hypothetical protein WDO73_35520 [Ignavibacteriota bacterium]